MRSFTRDTAIAKAMRKVVGKEIVLPSLAEEFLKAALDEHDHSHAAAMIADIQTRWPEDTLDILGSVRSDILYRRKNLSHETWLDGRTVAHMERNANFCASHILQIANHEFVESRIQALSAHEFGTTLPRKILIRHTDTLESVVSRFWDIVESNDDEKYDAPKDQKQAPMKILYDMAPALSWFVERAYGPGALRPVIEQSTDDELREKAAVRMAFLEATIKDWERLDENKPTETPQGAARKYNHLMTFVPQ